MRRRGTEYKIMDRNVAGQVGTYFSYVLDEVQSTLDVVGSANHSGCCWNYQSSEQVDPWSGADYGITPKQ